MSERSVKNDLRWLRTERHLLRAFEEAIGSTPLDKITVTGLARTAEVNKATFYLHYRDIYDLAQTYVESLAQDIRADLGDLSIFFDEPRRFVSSLVDVLSGKERERAIRLLEQNRLGPQFMSALVGEIKTALHEIRPVPDNLRSGVALSFFLHGLMGSLSQYGEASNRAELVDSLGDLFATLIAHGDSMALKEGLLA